jgi:hypothetical protein
VEDFSSSGFGFLDDLTSKKGEKSINSSPVFLSIGFSSDFLLINLRISGLLNVAESLPDWVASSLVSTSPVSFNLSRMVFNDLLLDMLLSLNFS